MKAITFPEVNVEIAKNQPEFNTLPAHATKDGMMIIGFDLNEDEMKNLIRNKRLWIQLQVGPFPFPPFAIIPVKDYFKSVIRDGSSFIVQYDDDFDNEIDNEIKNITND